MAKPSVRRTRKSLARCGRSIVALRYSSRFLVAAPLPPGRGPWPLVELRDVVAFLTRRVAVAYPIYGHVIWIRFGSSMFKLRTRSEYFSTSELFKKGALVATSQLANNAKPRSKNCRSRTVPFSFERIANKKPPSICARGFSGHILN